MPLDCKKCHFSQASIGDADFCYKKYTKTLEPGSFCSHFMLSEDSRHVRFVKSIKNAVLGAPLDEDFDKLPFSKQTEQFGQIAEHFLKILEILDLDTSDPSLINTPGRVAKMYIDQIFSGLDFNHFPRIMLMPASEASGERHIIMQNNITMYSMCEHHFLPIVGTVSVAYVPNNVIVGLSKLNRVVQFFARRPQIQERLTEQIYSALSYILGTDTIAVRIKATHFCVKMRGVSDNTSEMLTNKLGGGFKTDGLLRNEYMNLLGQSL
jgi:GTP cyclohydrolase IA